ncbi:MAG: phosphatase PAP2 family protein, partial [Magnetococcus sp. YQC-5]
AQFTELDLLVQDRLYDFTTRSWLVNADAFWPRWIFYTGPKLLFVAIGAGAFVAWLLTWKLPAWQPYRLRLGLFLLALILIPVTIAGIKNVSNIHCPWSLERYGGGVPHVPPFSAYPAGYRLDRPGKCFPAGHPSGGFAFMMLYFVFTSPRARRAGLAAGLLLGWVLGLYQMFKGAHFFSHVLLTMLASWLMILLIRRLCSQGTMPGVETLND